MEKGKGFVFGKEKEKYLLKRLTYIFLETYALNALKVDKFYMGIKLDISILNKCWFNFFLNFFKKNIKVKFFHNFP